MKLLARIGEDGGFGLIELSVGMALTAIVAMGSLSVLDSGSQTLQTTRARVQAVEDLRGGLERVTKDVRQALSVDRSSTRDRLVMRTLVGGSERDVVYEAPSGELQRSIDGGAAAPVVSGVTSSTIFCYDPPDCLLESPDATAPAVVRITLAVTRATGRALSASTLTLDVHPRNTAG